jgi:hypothetical protein
LKKKEKGKKEGKIKNKKIKREKDFVNIQQGEP